PVLVVAAMHRVSVVSWRHAGVRTRPAAETTSSRARTGKRLAGDALQPGPNAALLRTLHTLTSLLCIAFLPLGGPFPPQAVARALVAWFVALGLLVWVFVAVAALDDVVTGLRLLLPRSARTVGIAVAVALIIAAGLTAAPRVADRAGLDSMSEGILGALVLVWLVFALTLIPLAQIGRA